MWNPYVNTENQPPPGMRNSTFRSPVDDIMEVDDDDSIQASREYVTVPGDWKGIGPAPAPRVPRDVIQAFIPFAGPYKSVFSTRPRPAEEVLECLQNVNCSYLSSGVAPNLLQLKQHAQSLTVLIKEMTVSQDSALIDNANTCLSRSGTFSANESFDWLNDLTTRYTTDDSHHLQPLTSVLNTVEQDPTTGLPINICPLQKAPADRDGIQPHPLATHENLIGHANELLERLDHEYSARGGLLSIFPTDMQTSDREKAEKTLLGQMILWVQDLVQRIHHLERLYANSLDVLAEEAVVPIETLSALGTTGRKGREVVYSQDRFVLVNAGDDLWEFINAEFERKEVIDTQVDKSYRELGTTGEAIWAERGGREFARGITCIDVYTRYYRLHDSPLKTIFVMPAYEIHPGTKVTREMEQQPTVVSVVKPVWPERMSVLETKHKDDMAELKISRYELQQMGARNDLHEQEVQILADNNAKLNQEKRVLAKERDDAINALKQHPNEFKLQVHKDLSKASEVRNEAARVRPVYEKQIADTKAALEKAQTDAKEMQEARQRQAKTIAAREAQKEKEWVKKLKELEDRDADIGRAAQEVIPELKKVWLKQMTDSQILIEFLSSEEVQHLLRDMEIPDHIMKLGQEKGRRLYDEAARKIPDTVPRASLSSSEAERFSVDGDAGAGGFGSAEEKSSRGDLEDAPTTPSWRRQARAGSVSVRRLPLTSKRGDSQRSPKQRSQSRGQISGSSQRSFHGGPSPKQVAFSPTLEQGPSSSGPSKRRPSPLGEEGPNKIQKMGSSDDTNTSTGEVGEETTTLKTGILTAGDELNSPSIRGGRSGRRGGARAFFAEMTSHMPYPDEV